MWGSHGGEDVGLLGCNAMWTCTHIRKFRRNILPPSSGLKLETVCFFETLVSTYKSTLRYNPEDQHLQLISHPVSQSVSHVISSLNSAPKTKDLLSKFWVQVCYQLLFLIVLPTFRCWTFWSRLGTWAVVACSNKPLHIHSETCIHT
jgi:hypothetical protein